MLHERRCSTCKKRESKVDIDENLKNNLNVLFTKPGVSNEIESNDKNNYTNNDNNLDIDMNFMKENEEKIIRMQTNLKVIFKENKYRTSRRKNLSLQRIQIKANRFPKIGILKTSRKANRFLRKVMRNPVILHLNNENS